MKHVRFTYISNKPLFEVINFSYLLNIQYSSKDVLLIYEVSLLKSF